MKKKIIGIVVIGVLCVATGIGISRIEKSKCDDVKTTQTENCDDQNTRQNVMDMEENFTGEIVGVDSVTKLIMTSEVEVEPVSYEVIDDDDIANQTRYPVEYFHSGELPVVDASEPEKVYVFVKCKFRNTLEKPVDCCIDLNLFFKGETQYLGFTDYILYFDRSENALGEDREKWFAWYEFGANEEIECVIGYAVKMKEEFGDSLQYYIGYQPIGVEYFTIENTKGLIIPLSEMESLND